ncbi:MAG: phosphomannomutase/phosphoglucomutase [Deltaproteobacteria bacterium]|nr:phosphomannomutase/phosphoglucomutase [Deltaproteobacteria bacterium]
MNSQGITACFKAYDIRGKVPEELDTEFCYALGLALASEFKLGSGSGSTVVCGRDVRPSGFELGAAFTEALLGLGIGVTDIGVCGTEEVYFAAARHAFDLGVMFTASHNPAEYNGIKIVRSGAVPLSGDSGLFSLRDRILNKKFAEKPAAGQHRGQLRQVSYQDEYIAFILSCLEPPVEKHPLKIVLNPGNGSAGALLKKILPALPGEFIVIHGDPDGTFPNGIPNPLLPECRADTAQAVLTHKADLGLAWDGDFDRCFFYDAQAEFIESYYLIGLFAKKILRACPGGKILYDTRLTWNTIEQVLEANGVPVQSKTGHAFMKERMRGEQAVYGGEMSAHHYFRNFYFCDSGMLPWITLMNILAELKQPLEEVLAERIKAYPCSGEINFKLARALPAKEIFNALKVRYAPEIKNENYLDGLSADCGNWRFNLRSSNTEPLLRLNVESKGDAVLMRDKTAEISALIGSFSGV